MKKLFNTLILVAALCFLTLLGVWGYGFHSYIQRLSSPIEHSTNSTDALVVLTGGSGRVSTGFELLEDNKAQKLFISGVGRDLIVDDLLALWEGMDDGFDKSRVVLGYAAQSTHGNAVETAEWLAQQNYTSIRLITSNYHMPRAWYEFKNEMPEIEITTHPVEPEDLDFYSLRGLSLLAREYSKFFWVVTRDEFAK